VTRWQRYWFADGGRVACAFVRVGIAMAVIMSLAQLATLSTVELPGPAELYRPVGPWMVLGGFVPPDPLILALWIVAWVGSVAMLLGLFTRVATALSFAGAVSIAALSYASSNHWSHQYNVVLLAQLAFLGARGGDTLSLDAVIRHLRGLPPLDVPRGYQWSLRLVQLAIALMFAGAVFHKLLHGHFTLRWALSDNLRHHLLVRYDLAGLERPELVTWLLEESWRYRAAAVGNMVAQLLPIFACVFVRRPLVRAFCGGVFVVEVLLLGFVVSLWNEHWLPLVVAFIDWDRLNGDAGHRPWVPGRVPWPRRVFVLVFFVYELVTAFVPGLDQKLNTYPFSGFPMFATIRAAEPYDEHLPYGVPGDRFVVTSDQPLDAVQQRWFDHANRGVFTIKDPVQLETKLRAILETARRRYPERGIRGVRHELAIFEAPAYPAPARFDVHPIATTGELVDGAFRTVLGRLDGSTATLRPKHVDVTSVELVYYANDKPVAWKITATRDGDRFVMTGFDADPAYVVAKIGDRAWLVGSRRTWKW
jgi:uncharacterized membrane protein YphA (DoxX/SURF4 family)